MLLIIRLIIVILYSVMVCALGIIYCLFSPRNPRHVATFGHIFGNMAVIFGLKVKTRLPKELKNFSKAIYISNHQNYYDMITVSNIILPSTITIGKKSLIWIPLFGQLYWLTGNILIDRKNNVKAHNTVIKVINKIKSDNVSIWIFPEGTRNNGKGILPFKNGAFYIAIKAKVPIIPVCVSETYKKINLNKFNNGLVIVEMLPPIEVKQYNKTQVRELSTYCRNIMIKKINELNNEVTKYKDHNNSI